MGNPSGNGRAPTKRTNREGRRRRWENKKKASKQERKKQRDKQEKSKTMELYTVMANELPNPPRARRSKQERSNGVPSPSRSSDVPPGLTNDVPSFYLYRTTWCYMVFKWLARLSLILAVAYSVSSSYYLAMSCVFVAVLNKDKAMRQVSTYAAECVLRGNTGVRQ